MDFGDVLFLEASTRLEQKHMKKDLEKLKKDFSQNNPVEATYIEIGTLFKDRKLWVLIHKTYRTPTVGFVLKENSNELKKIELDFDPERERRISLMIKDGLSKDEIVGLMEGLTMEEEEKYFP